jgi:hypothetical protein
MSSSEGTDCVLVTDCVNLSLLTSVSFNSPPMNTQKLLQSFHRGIKVNTHGCINSTVDARNFYQTILNTFMGASTDPLSLVLNMILKGVLILLRSTVTGCGWCFRSQLKPIVVSSPVHPCVFITKRSFSFSFTWNLCEKETKATIG